MVTSKFRRTYLIDEYTSLDVVVKESNLLN